MKKFVWFTLSNAFVASREQNEFKIKIIAFLCAHQNPLYVTLFLKLVRLPELKLHAIYNWYIVFFSCSVWIFIFFYSVCRWIPHIGCQKNVRQTSRWKNLLVTTIHKIKRYWVMFLFCHSLLYSALELNWALWDLAYCKLVCEKNKPCQHIESNVI